MRARAGYGLAELVVAAALASIVLGCVVTLLTGQLRLAGSIGFSADATDALAISADLLMDELRESLSAVDHAAPASDSVALRAFRGWALVCAADADVATARYRGARAPEPAKDSVLVIGARMERAVAFATAAAQPTPGCSARAREQLIRVTTGAALHPGDVLVFFERGAYHLSGHALRWRTGAAGRQPLTAEVLDAASRFTGPASVGLDLGAVHSPAPRLVVGIATLHDGDGR